MALYILARVTAPGRPAQVADSGKPSLPSVDADKPGEHDTPAAQHGNVVNTDFIPATAEGIIVIHPKRMLASAMLAALPQDEWFRNFAAIGLDPRQMEEAVIFFHSKPDNSRATTGGLILRFAAPLDRDKLLAGVAAGGKEARAGDQTYYLLDQPTPGLPGAVFIADTKTILAADEPVLMEMLSAHAASSPVLDRLRQADWDSDVTSVAAVPAKSDPLSPEMKRLRDSIPPELASAVGANEQINYMTHTVNVTKDPLYAADMEAKDEKGAADVLKFVNAFGDYLQKHYDEVRKAPFVSAVPEGQDLLDRISADLKGDFKAVAEGTHVRLSVKRPAATKELIAKLVPAAAQMFAAKAPPPEPPPAKDVRRLAVDWVRENNALGPTHKIVADTEQRLNNQVGFDQGFVATVGATLVKSHKPTMLVGWNNEVFPLELTPEQGKQANMPDAVVGVMAVPAGNDLGPGPPVGQLSALRLDHADSLDGAARMMGTVQFHRTRPDDPNEYCSMRLMIPGPRSRVTVYQHLSVALPKGDGAIALDFPPLNDHQLGLTGPVPVLVEVIAYLDAERQGKPFVSSNAMAQLVVPADK